MNDALVITLGGALALAIYGGACLVYDRQHTERGRWPADRGSALSEYAIIMAAVVFVALGAVTFLQEQSADTMERESNCIGNPYQPECESGPIDPDATYWTEVYP